MPNLGMKSGSESTWLPWEQGGCLCVAKAGAGLPPPVNCPERLAPWGSLGSDKMDGTRDGRSFLRMLAVTATSHLCDSLQGP